MNLGKTEAVATIAVHDLAKAREFYEGKLELKPEDEPNDMVVSYKSGASRIFVYKSDYAGGYKATVATWPMAKGIEDLVKTLKSKGVTFETYDEMSDMKREGDLYVFGDMKNAWFKDPEGNILALVQHPKNAH